MLKQQITDAMKAAMKSGDKARLGVVRLMLAAVKQREVDERIELDDSQVLAVLDKMVKQRRDSIKQYGDAGRDDLAAVEASEIEVIQEFLPAGLSEAEVMAIINEECFFELDAAPVRVSALNVPIPYNHTLEKAALPNANDVVEAVRKIFGV